jgi:hypothetical protein
MTPIFIHMFGYKPWGAVTYRAVGALCNTPVRIVCLALAEYYLFPAILKLRPNRNNQVRSDDNG